MTRKSKQAGGNFPLTYYERTKKFASSEYGTTARRLAGHSQYQLGDCALSLTSLRDAKGVLCTPSGYLYADSAILEYLLAKTQEIKEQQEAYERQQAEQAASRQADHSESQARKRSAFDESQKLVKKSKTKDAKESAQEALKQSSYWLAEAQPVAGDRQLAPPPVDRPPSPHSQCPLRRKDLWPIQLLWDKDDPKKLVCAVSSKAIHSKDVTAYWTDKKEPGTIVLTSVYSQLIQDSNICPITSKKVKYVRALQKSGTSFAASGQTVQVTKYAPTIT